MKKIFMLLAACILYSTASQSQPNYCGTYVNDSGISLMLDKGNFKLIMPNAARNGRFSEIMAEGVFKPVDNSFLEFNSFESPAAEVAKSLKITQETEPGSTDSIQLEFSVPYLRSGLRITVYTNTLKHFTLNYSSDNRELNIPGNVKSISLYITPEDVQPHTADGLSYGIVAFDSLVEYPIEENANRIHIEIPAMDDSFFEKYYVKGDYVRVVKDTVCWKGELFVKKK